MLLPERCEKPIRKLRKFLKRPSKRLGIEQIHDLRANSRRFESNVETLGLSSKKNERRLLKQIARIRKRAGKIRDVDVLTGHALRVHVDGEQDCLVQLIETLGASRTKQVEKLRVLVDERGARMRRNLKRTLAKSEDLVEEAQNPNSTSASNVSDEIAARALHATNDLKSPASLNKNNLHEYRLKVKELRYILQLFDTSQDQEFVRKLGQVKDAIGEWHDWEELIARATEVLDHGRKCRLLPKLREISEGKYARALAVTNQMRRNFLTLKRAAAPKAGHPVAKFPVLSGISAITA